MSRPGSSAPMSRPGTNAPNTNAPTTNINATGNANAAPKATGPGVNTAVVELGEHAGRILCVADVRGKLTTLNDLAREHGANAILHTGDFGFFEESSLERIADRTLRHLTQYSPLIPGPQRTHLLAPDNPPAAIRSTVNVSLLSEFPLLLSGTLRLDVPVFALWGACEDVRVLEKFRTGVYNIPNLTVLDEATTRVLNVGGVRLRLLGLGGALVPHKLFDNGDGLATIAGAGGTMWTTALQIGELVDTAQRVHDGSETRILLSHASPGREGLVAQLALALKADLTVSAGLHFRYASSWNDFSVQQDYNAWRAKLSGARDSFRKVWDNVRTQVDAAVDAPQRVLLDKFLAVTERVPPAPGAPGAPGAATTAGEDPSWKNAWHWNLCDAAYGALLLDIREGRVSATLASQGFNFAYRKSATAGETVGAVQSQGQGVGQNASSARHTPAPRAPLTNNNTANGKPTTPAPAAPAAPSTTGTASAGTPAPSTPGPTPPPGSGGKTEEQRAAERAEKFKAKKERMKEKKAEKRAAEREASASGTPVATNAGTGASDEGGELRSDTPAARSEGAGSAGTGGGAGTPTSKRPPRNPWTLFFRVPAGEQGQGPDEGALRAFFGDAQSGIVRVVYPQSFGGREKRMAYVEFGDEEAMLKGLNGHAEKIGEMTPEVSIAKDKAEREASGEFGSFRGRGRGRGRGGGFAARGFAAAGLTRGGGPGSAQGGGGPPK